MLNRIHQLGETAQKAWSIESDSMLYNRGSKSVSFLAHIYVCIPFSKQIMPKTAGQIKMNGRQCSGYLESHQESNTDFHSPSLPVCGSEFRAYNSEDLSDNVIIAMMM